MEEFSKNEQLKKDIEVAIKSLDKAVKRANKILKKQGFAITAQADLHLLKPKET